MYSTVSPFVYTGLPNCFIFIVGLYPYFATSSYYGDLKVYKGLYGMTHLKEANPSDYQAILWINDHIQDQPVILEAVGESYTDYARVSANTGLPTVIGWPVHEWLWRGTYDEAGKRIGEVEQIYTSSDAVATKALLKKYNVAYIFVGALERQKYPQLNEEKIKKLGNPVYTNGDTVLYKLF